MAAALAGIVLYVAMLRLVVVDVCAQPCYRFGTREAWIGIVVVGSVFGVMLYLLFGRPF